MCNGQRRGLIESIIELFLQTLELQGMSVWGGMSSAGLFICVFLMRNETFLLISFRKWSSLSTCLIVVETWGWIFEWDCRVSPDHIVIFIHYLLWKSNANLFLCNCFHQTFTQWDKYPVQDTDFFSLQLLLTAFWIFFTFPHFCTVEDSKSGLFFLPAAHSAQYCIVLLFRDSTCYSIFRELPLHIRLQSVDLYRKKLPHNLKNIQNSLWYPPPP